MPRIKQAGLHTKGQCTLQSRGKLRVMGEVQTSLCAPTSPWLGQPRPHGTAPITSPLDYVMLALRAELGRESSGLGLKGCAACRLLPSQEGAQPRVPQPPFQTKSTALSTRTFLGKSRSEDAERACPFPPSPACLIFMKADYKIQIYHLSLQPSVPWLWCLC